MRLPLVVLLGGAFVSVRLPCAVNAEEAPRPDMRQLVLETVKQRWAAPVTPKEPVPSQSAVLLVPQTDPDVVTLPPILVNAPVLRVPSPADTVRPVVAVVQRVDYQDYAVRDAKNQRALHELLDLADLTRLSGDAALSEKVRRETYRALTRDPTPLQRAMDRSVNGGRY
jgi:hypothetical protein